MLHDKSGYDSAILQKKRHTGQKTGIPTSGQLAACLTLPGNVMQFRLPVRTWMTAPVLLALAVGCDNAAPRFKVSGTVRFNGKPLEQGIIMFVPSAEGPTQASAIITNGKYEIPRAQGLAVGKYKVVLSSPDGSTPVDPNVPPGPSGNFASEDRIPPRFNTESTLEIEVTKNGDNKFDFSIP